VNAATADGPTNRQGRTSVVRARIQESLGIASDRIASHRMTP
jgi:hypothetical protein